jgi:hypothetical protein
MEEYNVERAEAMEMLSRALYDYDVITSTLDTIRRIYG